MVKGIYPHVEWPMLLATSTAGGPRRGQLHGGIWVVGLRGYVAKRMVSVPVVPFRGKHKHHSKGVDPYSVGCHPVGTPLGGQGSAVLL